MRTCLALEVSSDVWNNLGRWPRKLSSTNHIKYECAIAIYHFETALSRLKDIAAMLEAAKLVMENITWCHHVQCCVSARANSPTFA